MTDFIPPPHYYEYLLGTDASTGGDIWIGQKDYALGGYLLGKRRMGKSTLLQLMIRQSIKKGHGVCLIDPHGDLLEEIIHLIPKQRMDDVILYDPLDANGAFPIGLNIYHCEDKDDAVAVQYTVDGVLSLYKKLWKTEFTQPMVEDVLRMSALTIIANGMTMVDIPKLLFDETFRRRLVANVTQPDVLDFWKVYDNPRSIEREQGGSAVGRRLRAFTTSGIIRYIVGQTSILPFREILDQRKILLVSLPGEKMKELTSMLGSIIVSKLLQAALMRSDTDARPQFHLYCDEYSEFATEDFSTIISQAGKYNIIPFISHQSTGQISEENQDSAIQLGNLFCFGLIGKDAERLAVQYNLAPDQQKLVIPSDPTYHLTDHPAEAVRQFEREFVRPLLEAKALTSRHVRSRHAPYGPGMGIYEVETEEEILPRHEFHRYAGEVEFEPAYVRDALHLIDRMLYYTMTNPTYQWETDWVDLAYLMSHLLHCFFTVRRLDEDGWFKKPINDLMRYYVDRSDELKQHDPPLWPFWEITVFGLFHSCLYSTLAALHRDKIYVDPSTGKKPQQTYADKEKQIANELANLTPHYAHIKLTSGEYILKTNRSETTSKPGAKKIQVVERTRSVYCKTRAEVEEEIQRRQSDDPSTTKRKHIL